MTGFYLVYREDDFLLCKKMKTAFIEILSTVNKDKEYKWEMQ